MSTDDVIELANEPCPCGGGRLVVHSRIPDHPWVRDHQETWDASITCQTCDQAYALVEQGGRSSGRVPLILVSAAELAERKDKLRLWREESAALMNSPLVKAILDRLTSALRDQPSIAAGYRFLAQHRLVYDSVGTFRKRFHQGDEEAWVRANITASNLPAVMAALGHADEDVSGVVARIEALRKQSRVPLTPIGEPVASVRQSNPPF